MSIQSGVQKGPLKDMQRILWEWCRIVKAWCEKRNWDDVPWWYNERASLSLLAADVWATGGVMLEEYSTEKGKKKIHWQGRGDLFLQIRKQKYVVEAKETWMSISPRSTKWKKKIENAINAARKSAR